MTEERPADAAEQSDWEKRRRLADVFGEVLPETTSDDCDPQSPADAEAGDHWLRSQVPPHHG
jgi:hypothetical protein